VWLKKGANEVIVLDLEERAGRWKESRTEAVYETPAG
jgi:hypothetical protein